MAGKEHHAGPAHGGERVRLPTGGLARRVAVNLLTAVLVHHNALDDAIASAAARPPMDGMEARDRALARAIAATTLRRLGEIDRVLGTFASRPLPEERGRLKEILRAATAQLLLLGMAPHAVINIAVAQAKADRGAHRFDKLVNAVLRRVDREGAAVVASGDAAVLNTPDWLWRRWSEHYGEATARGIAARHLEEPPLDVSVNANLEDWAKRLGGVMVTPHTVRFKAEGRIEALAGFSEGAWWVQDAAAALPALLFGTGAAGGRPRRVADLCAAPGGKTAQLIRAGAAVTAVDISEQRLGRLRLNLHRLRLAAETVCADATTWRPPEPFDGVLLDAPCTSTGTIRRHPDIPHLKRPADLDKLVDVQARLLDSAAELVRPGGMLVYCTCSLEPEEGEGQIARLLARRGDLEPSPISAGEIAAHPAWITPAGHLRTLPCHLERPEPGLSGMDGFFAARLVKKTGG